MKKVFNKSDFIINLSAQCDSLSEKTVEEATRQIIDLMSNTLRQDGRIEIRGFGSFNLHHRDARIARNPKTGEKVQVSAKAIPYFKAGKVLRERVNQSKY